MAIQGSEPGPAIARCYDAAVSNVGRRIVVGVAWLLAVAALALGSAGIVAGMAHPPGTPSRAELTWASDRALGAQLDDATAELAVVAGEVETLAGLARSALTAMIARDSGALDATRDEGSVLVARIAADAAALRRTVTDLPGAEADAAIRYSADLRARRAALVDALAATEGLNAAWSRLVSVSLAASRLTDLLLGHDPTTAAGAELGRSAKYDEAVATIDAALAMLDAADELRDQLANTTDVTILDEWIRRNRTYDEALRRLYELLGEARGRITPEIRAAFEAEEAARRDLPPDTRGLVVIMAEIGRGGLNQAVIAIEQARGRLALAVEGASAAP